MRIGIDARLGSYIQSGITQYTHNLIRALAGLDQENKYVILKRYKDTTVITEQKNFRSARLYTPSHHHLEPYLLSVELLPIGLDVVHWTDFIPPFFSRCPSIITVHDLAFLLYPHFLTHESARYYGLIDRAVRHATHIIAVSEATKNDIIRLTGTSAKKITVIYEAAQSIYAPIEDTGLLAEMRARHGLPDRFILFVGTIEPRKNLPTLIRAFDLLKKNYRPDVGLVIVGKEGWLFDEVYRLVEELGLEGQICFAGRVPTKDLPALYSAAEMLVLPSFYEGFGLPPLEAMACGTPVIVSNTSAMPEVVQDAALRVTPEDVEGFTVAMWRLLSEPDLRQDMVVKGKKRAAFFSWERAASETLDVYRKFTKR